MQPIIYGIRLDAGKTGSQASIRVQQGDVRSRRLSVSLCNGSAPYPIDPGVTAVLGAVKPDATLIYDDCEIDGNTIRYTMTPQMLAAAGTVHCQLTLYGSQGEVLMSPEFAVYAVDPLIGQDAVVSSDAFGALEAALSQAHADKARWGNPTAEAEDGDEAGASVKLTGGGVRFSFVLPRGIPGQKGEKGDPGAMGAAGAQGGQGADGKGLVIIDCYPTPEALAAAVPSPSPGDAYGIGSGIPFDIYIYGQESGWVNNGPLQGPAGPQGPKGDPGDPNPAFEDITAQTVTAGTVSAGAVYGAVWMP